MTILDLRFDYVELKVGEQDAKGLTNYDFRFTIELLNIELLNIELLNIELLNLQIIKYYSNNHKQHQTISNIEDVARNVSKDFQFLELLIFMYNRAMVRFTIIKSSKNLLIFKLPNPTFPKL